MRWFYKVKKIFRSLMYWFIRREMVFLKDGVMYKYCYTVAIKYLKINQIIKNSYIENTEFEIAKVINSCKIEQIIADKKLSFSDIEQISSDRYIEIKGQRLVNLGKTSFMFFNTLDGKENASFICFDKDVVALKEINDIFDEISKQVNLYNKDDFLNTSHSITLLHPKTEVYHF